MLVFSQAAWGGDPDWASDEDMKARIPIMSLQEGSSNMATKYAMQAEEEATMEAARQAFKGPKDKSAPGVQVTVGPIPTGVIDRPTSLPGWSRLYKIENGWQQIIGGQRITVYAGSVADDELRGTWNSPEQGVIIVMIVPPGPDTKPSSYQFFTPERAGRVKVKAADGLRLTLASVSSDAEFVFDVTMRRWLGGR